MTRRFSLTATRLAVAAALTGTAALGGLALFYAHPGTAVAASAPPPPPPAVDVAEVAKRSVTDWQAYSGRLEAVDRVEVRPQVSGTVTAVHFKDGRLVKKGDVLFTIDPRPYAAEVARSQAQLAAAEARVAYTGADVLPWAAAGTDFGTPWAENTTGRSSGASSSSSTKMAPMAFSRSTT